MPRTTRALFLATIALSVFLLFTLELVADRLVLPVFGGSPGVRLVPGSDDRRPADPPVPGDRPAWRPPTPTAYGPGARP